MPGVGIPGGVNQRLCALKRDVKVLLEADPEVFEDAEQEMIGELIIELERLGERLRRQRPPA